MIILRPQWLTGLAVVCVLLSGCASDPASNRPPAVSEIAIKSQFPSSQAIDDGRINRPRKHTVRKGETLGEIAFKYGLAYTDLALWNSIANPDLIEIGQQLQLHPPKNQPEIAVVPKKTERPVPQRIGEGSDRATRVTRTRIDVGTGSTKTPALGVSEPKALKINYSQQNFARLQAAAFGGATQAALTITGREKNSATPRNINEQNGINWSWPVNGKLIKKFSDTNLGIDITGARGQPIFASADGKVIYAGSGIKGYGQLVIIKHTNEYLTNYAHNDRILVAEGETVKRGTKIAEMGDSGADRIALHFGIRRGEKTYNPQRFLPKTP